MPGKVASAPARGAVLDAGPPSVDPVASADAVVLDMLERALRRLAASAERGSAAIFSQAEDALREICGASGAQIVLNAGGAWRRWEFSGELRNGGAVVDLPAAAVEWLVPTPIGDALFVPVRAGMIAAVIAVPQRAAGVWRAASAFALAFEFAITALERKHLAAQESQELDVMQRVALRILQSDLHEILLLITHETRRLLDADICGIMLREGDAVVMQRCVGNISPATASLRMEAGQGVAGRVVATKAPCCVDNYVDSDVISNDFVSLARAEMVRSALAAPLISQDDVVGVLEVWRRQTTPFEEHHTQRLVALANITSLAIENARLAQARQTIVEELAATNRALTERYEVIRSSAAFQNELIRLQLEGKNLAHVAALAGEHLAADVLILDANLAVEGARPERAELSDGLRATIKAALRKIKAMPAQAVAASYDGAALLVQAACAGAEILGYVVLVGCAADAGTELALSQICTATTLHLIERRAAGRARAETLGAVLWDLLEGSEEVRRFALVRARELHIDLDGRQRVYLCKLGGIEEHAATAGWSANELGACRRRIARAHADVPALAGSVRLAGMRGNVIALVCGGAGAADADRCGAELAHAINAYAPGVCVHVGTSAPCDAPGALGEAYREARISLEVARQRGRIATATYEDAGIVGLLLSLRDEADVRKLVRTIFGSLLDLKADDRDRMLGTLGTFFEMNCNRTAAAERLGIHEKTVAYRLAKIRDLTGLDFGKHETRLLADIALRMHGMTTAPAPPAD